ncbi:MAG: ABC transporter ATP-binding protein [Tissierellia bacterium]|nr:ABC transporter ATP-binding protein [Tissierellia bacterium]
MEKIIIDIKNLTKAFGDNIVLDDINLYIRENEFLTLLGPSGCGKTTTLRVIAGFEDPTSGSVMFQGKDITKIPANERAVNTVFQKYALFPHLNVYENIAFGLKIKKMPSSEIDKKVKEVLELVNLSGFEKRDVESLSGGQQQRIAIARALVNEPKVLLLDEPLAALDLKLRKGMQIELKNIQERVGITFVFVTHDQEEALTMSDTIVVMNEGKIQQIGTPIDIYNEPKNSFVANFIGQSNIISGIMKEDFKVEIFDVDFPCVDKGFLKDEVVDVVIRPEDVEIVSTDSGKLKGEIESVIFKGVHYEIRIVTDKFTWVSQTTKKYNEGDIVGIDVLPDNIHIMHRMVTE